MTSNTGLGCLTGFEWNSTEQTCRWTCQTGIDISDQNVPTMVPQLPDAEACQKYCRTVSGAKFATYFIPNKNCHCKTGNANQKENPNVISCSV